MHDVSLRKEIPIRMDGNLGTIETNEHFAGKMTRAPGLYQKNDNLHYLISVPCCSLEEDSAIGKLTSTQRELAGYKTVKVLDINC